MTGEGHWDAAFELLKCRPFAIDLKNTPYGETAYNGHVGGTTTSAKNKCWQDVADGLIYYAPLYDHVAAWGIEGLITKEFEPEIKRRLTLFFQATQPGAETTRCRNTHGGCHRRIQCFSCPSSCHQKQRGSEGNHSGSTGEESLTIM